MLVLEPLGRDSNAGHGQPWVVPSLGLLSRSYKMICSQLPLALGMDMLEKGYTVNQGWLLLFLGLAPVGGHQNMS